MSGWLGPIQQYVSDVADSASKWLYGGSGVSLGGKPKGAPLVTSKPDVAAQGLPKDKVAAELSAQRRSLGLIEDGAISSAERSRRALQMAEGVNTFVTQTQMRNELGGTPVGDLRLAPAFGSPPSPDNLFFQINDQGNLEPTSGLDFETKSTYTLRLLDASDTPFTLTINVIDINEAPNIASISAKTAAVDSNSVVIDLGAGLVQDPDSGDLASLVYRLEDSVGNPVNGSRVVGDGSGRVIVTLDGTGNTLPANISYRLTATDPDGLSASRTFDVDFTYHTFNAASGTNFSVPANLSSKVAMAAGEQGIVFPSSMAETPSAPFPGYSVSILNFDASQDTLYGYDGVFSSANGSLQLPVVANPETGFAQATINNGSVLVFEGLTPAQLGGSVTLGLPAAGQAPPTVASTLSPSQSPTVTASQSPTLTASQSPTVVASTGAPSTPANVSSSQQGGGAGGGGSNYGMIGAIAGGAVLLVVVVVVVAARRHNAKSKTGPQRGAAYGHDVFPKPGRGGMFNPQGRGLAMNALFSGPPDVPASRRPSALAPGEISGRDLSTPLIFPMQVPIPMRIQAASLVAADLGLKFHRIGGPEDGPLLDGQAIFTRKEHLYEAVGNGDGLDGELPDVPGVEDYAQPTFADYYVQPVGGETYAAYEPPQMYQPRYVKFVADGAEDYVEPRKEKGGKLGVAGAVEEDYYANEIEGAEREAPAALIIVDEDGNPLAFVKKRINEGDDYILTERNMVLATTQGYKIMSINAAQIPIVKELIAVNAHLLEDTYDAAVHDGGGAKAASKRAKAAPPVDLLPAVAEADDGILGFADGDGYLDVAEGTVSGGGRNAEHMV